MYSILVVFVFIVTYGSGCSACPDPCICSSTGLKTTVNCSNQSLDKIPRDLPANTTNIDLRGNPVACDCTFYEYWKNLKDKKIDLLGNCSSPQRLSGKSLADLTDEDFACDGLSTAAGTGANPTSSDQRPTKTDVPEPSSSEVISRSVVRSPVPRETPKETSIVSPSPASSTSVVLKLSSSVAVAGSSADTGRPAGGSPRVSPSVVAIATETINTAVLSTTVAPSLSTPVLPPSVPTFASSNTSGVTNMTQITPSSVSTVKTSSIIDIAPIPLEPPRIIEFVDNRTVDLDSIVTVKCIARGNPPPDVNVTYDGAEGVAETSLTSEVEISFLAKISLEIRCVATNKLGRDKRIMKINVDQTQASYRILKVKLIKETFVDSMKDKESKEFRDLAARITTAVRSVLALFTGFLGASVVKLEPGSVKAEVLIKTLKTADDSVQKGLKAELEKAKLGNLAVDRYLYSFDDKAQACPSEFVNVTWNDAIYGDTDVQPCPRGAKGFAKRNCSVSGWYFPDYTQCRTDTFHSLKDQLNKSSLQKENQANFEQDALTIMQNLIGLTSPHEDFAMMAGDITTCTEILEVLVDYIASEKKETAHSEMEAKEVVMVASNVLHLTNEQEFIVAQKMIQTASQFILVLERYGLQAARIVSLPKDRNLATLIAENVVMGAGITRPESITEDIIFPNYNWPELEEVRKEWNATTFVLLDKKMIGMMEGGDEGIRVAAFLYRTLTEILSVKSAYSDIGLAFEINSAVISASMDPKPGFKLPEPVIIASRNLEEVDLRGDEPICAFWDFNMNAPHGGWSEEGCNISAYNRLQTTCQCDHMTNFAVLRKTALPPNVAQALIARPEFIYCIYIACWIIIAFAVITFLILLIFSPWLKPDRTWVMHMCVCASIIVAFVLILLGLASYNDLALCNIFSALVHYFFLCAMSWILTESVYMTTWDTTHGPRKICWIGYFILGWGLPGIPLIVTWGLNGLTGFESYTSCWMSLFNGLIWVFFVPAIFFFLVSCLVFVKVWRSITGPSRQALKGKYWRTRFRVHIRYSIILLLMFMITWLVGILLITYYLKALLCVLFIICCAVTGFMILLFYVLMDRQVRDAVKHCCCYCRRGRRGSYWVRGDDLWIEKSGDVPEQQVPERESLVPGAVEADEEDIELNGFGKDGEVEDPLLKLEPRPLLKEPQSLHSSEESFDPLYERVRAVKVEVEPIPGEEVEETKIEPIYAKVIKPKRLRHPESDSDDDDEDLTPEEREARGMRGLTREQVIRMAKKSDASKRVLKDYDSPTTSRDDLDRPRATYLLNQQELDEELKQFRTFFANAKSSSPTATDPPTSTPRLEQPSTSFESTSSFTKRETSTSVTQSVKSVEGDNSFSYKSSHKYESSSSTITSTKRTLSQESQPSVASIEEKTVEKPVDTSEAKAKDSPSSTAADSRQETSIDVSLEELDRLNEEESDSSSKPTAV